MSEIHVGGQYFYKNAESHDERRDGALVTVMARDDLDRHGERTWQVRFPDHVRRPGENTMQVLSSELAEPFKP